MFLGNLSSANEHETRKKKGGKKKSKDDVIEIEGSEFPHLRRLNPGERPILYSAEKVGDIPRDAIMGFLTTMVDMMLDEGNINVMINESVTLKKSLSDVAVNFQRDVMEHNFQIERNFGCRYLALIAEKHSNDVELIEATKKFMFTALQSYVKALNQRSRRYKNGTLTPPNPTQPMSRTTILEFLEGCNALMAMPETKEDLRAVFLATKEMPGQRIIELQRSLLPLLGYDADFGVACLNKINDVYPNDRELFQKFQMYAGAAEFAGVEAGFTDEQRAAWYRQLPPMMTHFPHMFFLKQRQERQMQQQRAFQQQAEMAQRAAMDRGEGPPPAPVGGDGSGRMDAESLRSSGMLSMLTSPEGREKLQGLAAKVQDSKARLEPVVSEWDLEKKKAFFDGFKDHPLLTVLSQNADPMAKMTALTTMESGEIDELMTLLIVIAQQDSGELLATLREQVAKESETSSPGTSSALNHIIKTMGSLANMSKVGPMGGGGGGGMSAGGHVAGMGGHVHSPECQHGHSGHGVHSGLGGMHHTAPMSDVASGKAASMDR